MGDLEMAFDAAAHNNRGSFSHLSGLLNKSTAAFVQKLRYVPRQRALSQQLQLVTDTALASDWRADKTPPPKLDQTGKMLVRKDNKLVCKNKSGEVLWAFSTGNSARRELVVYPNFRPNFLPEKPRPADALIRIRNKLIQDSCSDSDTVKGM